MGGQGVAVVAETAKCAPVLQGLLCKIMQELCLGVTMHGRSCPAPPACPFRPGESIPLSVLGQGANQVVCRLQFPESGHLRTLVQCQSLPQGSENAAQTRNECRIERGRRLAPGGTDRIGLWGAAGLCQQQAAVRSPRAIRRGKTRLPRPYLVCRLRRLWARRRWP